MVERNSNQRIKEVPPPATEVAVNTPKKPFWEGMKSKVQEGVQNLMILGANVDAYGRAVIEQFREKPITTTAYLADRAVVYGGIVAIPLGLALTEWAGIAPKVGGAITGGGALGALAGAGVKIPCSEQADRVRTSIHESWDRIRTPLVNAIRGNAPTQGKA